MGENKTIVYEATYKDKKNKGHKSTVRVNPRLTKEIFLSCSLVVITTACTIMGYSNNAEPKSVIEIDYENKDLDIINEIIKNHPEMLVSKEIVDYTVRAGDTLSEIAEKHGTTVSDIESMNKSALSKSKTLQIGTELRVTQVLRLPEIDREINILESYIFDYFLGGSEVAKIARGEVECEEAQILHYKTIVYGTKDAGEVDVSSIYGLAISAQKAYHKDGAQITQEKKDLYLSDLRSIIELIERKINLSGNARAVVPYEEYKEYCQNGNTNYKVEYTPYGDRIVK